MAKQCDVTGKKPMAGHQVSHSNRKTKKRTLPNVQQRKIWVPSLGAFVRIGVTPSGLRTINKQGPDAALSHLVKQKNRGH